MAWYEMNAGGIPASLKSDMNSVLNKKFGTVSQDYPPNGWPADVNLMGPLPEKTASGAIASFSDGADTVPVKSCKVAFGPGGGGGTPADPVALVGYNSVNVVKAGKNLLDASTATGNGTIWFYYDNGILLKKGVTYTFSCGNRGSGSISFYGTDHSTQLAYAYIDNSSASVTFTPTENMRVCPRIYQVGLTPSGVIDPQLETGSTATAYKPFVTPETISDSFGQTVYGGERDLVTDGMKKTADIYDLGNLTWYADANRTGLFYTGLISGAAYTNCALACEQYTVNNAKNPNTISDFEMSSMNSYGSNRIFIKNTDYAGYTGAQVAAALSGVQAVILLDTAEDITGLTAHDIDTNYADNNFYADIPDSTMTVEYRADIPLALNA